MNKDINMYAKNPDFCIESWARATKQKKEKAGDKKGKLNGSGNETKRIGK